MAEILPFRALRPQNEKAHTFSSPAYDADTVLKEAEGRPEHQEAKEPTYLELLRNARQPDNYEMARHNLKKLIEQQVLVQDDKDSIYIYRQQKGGHTYTGIMALASVKEYEENHIKRHELVRSDKQSSIERYFCEVGINGSPVLLAYPGNPAIKRLLEKLVEPQPQVQFTTSRGTQHEVWVVQDQESIRQLQEHFRGIEDIYIADGHHRCASAARIKDKANGFMACFVAAEEMTIYPFHRYLAHLNGVATHEMVERLRSYADIACIEAPQLPEYPGEAVLVLKDENYLIKLFSETPANAKEGLDVFRMEALLLEKVLGFHNIHQSHDISYAGGNLTLPELLKPVYKDDYQMLILLHPISSAELIAVSDEGLSLPPKSTWIEPKMRSGLVIHKIL